MTRAVGSVQAGTDDVEQAIVAALEGLHQRAATEHWPDTNPPWTKAIKQGADRCSPPVRLSHGGGINSDEGQGWLYDVVWYEQADDGRVTDVSLVAGSDLPFGDKIKYDFDKLTVARSKYRVVIFQAVSEDKAERAFENMRSWVSDFRRTGSGDRYLLACWVRSRCLFDHVVWP